MVTEVNRIDCKAAACGDGENTPPTASGVNTAHMNIASRPVVTDFAVRVSNPECGVRTQVCALIAYDTADFDVD